MQGKRALGMLLFLNVAVLAAQTAGNSYANQKPVPEQPIVQYRIEAELLEPDRLIAGERLTWTNPTNTAADELRFHLYYNAFRNAKTTFMTENGFFRQSADAQKAARFGAITVSELRLVDGEDLTSRLETIAPDDGNGEDRTVLRVKLPRPLGPGQTLQLQINFSLQVPDIFARTGKAGDYYFFGQWFPKLGVFQPDGTWHCHQFHSLSEFFADYGSYRVSLTVPERFVVGASGRQISEEKLPGNRKTLVFEESRIHDFAWAAFPHFTRFINHVRLPGNSQDTEIILLLSPSHIDAQERYLGALKFALRFFADYLFPYPYRTITLVAPPRNGAGSGAMEYPTLFTSGPVSLWGERSRLTELVTFHEFSHQYFYGLIGSDEFREPWLDEGVSTFFEMEMIREYFEDEGILLDLGILEIPDWALQRTAAAGLLALQPINTYSWKFVNGDYYAGNVYSKAGLLLLSLKNLVGDQRLRDFFRSYALKFRWGHPTSTDFIAEFNNYMGENFNWAFDQFINGAGNLDQAVFDAESLKVGSRPDLYRNQVTVSRNEGYFPVELLIRLENGKEIRYFWKENERWRRLVSYDPSPIRWAALDPDLKIPLDRNLANNSRVLRRGGSGLFKLAAALAFFFQNLLGLLPL